MKRYYITIISTNLNLTPPIGYGGIERVVYELALNLANLGHNVVLFAKEGSVISHDHIKLNIERIMNVSYNRENKIFNLKIVVLESNSG